MESLEQNQPELKVRIPKNIKVLKYTVKIDPYPKEQIFQGYCEMTFQVVSEDSVDQINFHMKDIQINQSYIETQQKEKQIIEVSRDEEYIPDTYKASFIDKSMKFQPGQIYNICMDYQGLIYFDTREKYGVFCSLDPTIKEKYGLKSNQLQTIEDEEICNDAYDNLQINTQCEPAHARKILPCIDEPAFKSVFSLKLLVKNPKHIALSNGNVVNIEDSKDGRWYQFEDTPLMSTYLFAFTIGQFDSISLLSKNNIKVTGYSPKGLSHQIEECVKIAAQSIDLYEEYFQIPYPLSKCDMVAYHEMHVRAMENWGLITFKRNVILNDKETTPTELFQRNTRSVAHEVSHMWFGNLVTMEWWDDIWLNEGFARFAEHHILDLIRPEYQLWDKYIFQVYYSAIQSDKNLRSTHPILVDVPEPDKLVDIFDEISYAKGSVICRMLNSFIGDPSVFQQCLKAYMNKFKYANATSNDLFKVFEEVSGKKVKEIFDIWINQPCFPEINIQRLSKTQYMLSQQCYDGQNSEMIWPIPINYITSEGQTGSFLFNQKSTVIEIDTLKEDEFVRFNHNQSGFYVLNYEFEEDEEDELTGLLKNILKFNSFDRAGILLDMHVKKPVEILLSLECFKEEDRLGIWYIIYDAFHKGLIDVLQSQAPVQVIHDMVIDTILASFRRLATQILNGQISEDVAFQLFDYHLKSGGVLFNHAEFVKFAINYFNSKFIEQEDYCNQIEPDIRESIYQIVCHNDNECYSKLFNHYHQFKDYLTEKKQHDELRRITNALLIVRDHSMIINTVENMSLQLVTSSLSLYVGVARNFIVNLIIQFGKCDNQNTQLARSILKIGRNLDEISYRIIVLSGAGMDLYKWITQIQLQHQELFGEFEYLEQYRKRLQSYFKIEEKADLIEDYF